MIRVKSPADLPDEPHYQVIVYATKTIYEDNGYGDHSARKVETLEQWVTPDLNTLNKFIQELEFERQRTRWPNDAPGLYSVVYVDRKLVVKKEITLV